MTAKFFFAKSAALFLLSASCLAAPGGHLVAGISDECETLSSIWGPGLRGMPESLTIHGGTLSIRSIDNGDDPYPSAEDMISTYAEQLGRALDAAEGPSVVAWIWFPPFQEWPTGYNASGFREWLGFRVTAYDADLPNDTGFYFPGIYMATDEAGPCFIARVGDGYEPDTTIGRIAVAGWWTLGLAWNAQGRTEYYAAPGRVNLTSGDLLHTTPTYDDPAANRSIDQLVGNFWALRMTYPPTGELSPDWTVDFLRVFVRTPPPLPQVTPSILKGQLRLEIAGCARGFRYILQRSNNLANWDTAEDLVSNGEVWVFEEPAVGHSFYRVARP